jgi:hypothetical protein
VSNTESLTAFALILLESDLLFALGAAGGHSREVVELIGFAFLRKHGQIKFKIPEKTDELTLYELVYMYST